MDESIYMPNRHTPATRKTMLLPQIGKTLFCPLIDTLRERAGVANISASFTLKQVRCNTALPLDQLWPDVARDKGGGKSRR